MTDLGQWVGRTRSVGDVIDSFSARAMEAVLDRPPGLDEGVALPAGWHWLYFKEAARSSELGREGHERRGDFLPPVPLPRRMWAGGRLEFGAPLRLGEEANRRSTILAVREKEGRSGKLVFVTVQHEVWGARGLAVLEEQDLVFRDVPPSSPESDAAASPSTSSAPPDARPLSTFPTDPVALFRFSALTFNGHRIHFDHPYATRTEGYPGLVVHGPLLALLLLDAASTEAVRLGRGSALAAFSYRSTAPVFCGEEIMTVGRDLSTAAGDSLELWATTTERGVAMTATAGWRV